MELNQQDLPFFVAYLLLDEAKRAPSGKRQTSPMKGFWVSRTREHGMRVSDRALRRHVCIESLRRVGGKSVSQAAADVATELRRETSAEVNVIRAGYYEGQPHAISWDFFFGEFLRFREWVLLSSEKQRQSDLDRYQAEYGRYAGERLDKLFKDLRGDPVQRDRQLTWFCERGRNAKARIESNRWNPESD